MNKQLEVFLGGTCNGSQWREILKPMLKINYFDPVVKDWTETAQKMELEKKESCDYLLYVITPLMIGFYSIAEAVDDSNKHNYKTVFCYLKEDNGRIFEPHQIKSLKATTNLIKRNGAKVFNKLEDVAEHLNELV